MSKIEWQSSLTYEDVKHLPWDVKETLVQELDQAVASLCIEYGVRVEPKEETPVETPFQKYKAAVLKEYNRLYSPDNPVDEYDHYFLAYLVGGLSTLVPEEKYALMLRSYEDKQ